METHRKIRINLKSFLKISYAILPVTVNLEHKLSSGLNFELFSVSGEKTTRKDRKIDFQIVIKDGFG